MSSPDSSPLSPPIFQTVARLRAPLQRFIAVAPNGGRRVYADHQAIPLKPDELAQVARSCLERGAAMIHLHVRDKAGRHLLDQEAYELAISAVKNACGDEILIQITTEALGIYPVEMQHQIVRDVRPDAASLAFREFVDESDGGESEETFATLLNWMRLQGAAAQIIIYDTDDLLRFRKFAYAHDLDLKDTNLLYVLGRYSDTPRGLHQLCEFTAFGFDEVNSLMVCAFGREELGAVTAAALFGADMRVGFENNLWLPDGRVAPNNAALIAAAAQAVTGLGMEIGTATQLRTLWKC